MWVEWSLSGFFHLSPAPTESRGDLNKPDSPSDVSWLPWGKPHRKHQAMSSDGLTVLRGGEEKERMKESRKRECVLCRCLTTV